MKLKKSFSYALRHSLPIFAGFLPLGLAYGVLMQNAGYNALWTGATCLFVFAGSLQFLMISFFTTSILLHRPHGCTSNPNSKISGQKEGRESCDRMYAEHGP